MGLFVIAQASWPLVVRVPATANVKVLHTLLGHKTATLTLDLAGHLFPDDLGRIADAFDAAAETNADQLGPEDPYGLSHPSENTL